MAKRGLNILAKYRLGKVLAELKDLQNDSKFNKIDTWILTEAIEAIEKILQEKEPQDVTDKATP